MLVEDNLVSLVNKRNQRMKMVGLSIQQHITNSIIKTEVIQKFEFEESFYVLFKDNPHRKTLKINLGDKLLKSRLEEKIIFAEQESITICKDKNFIKFQDYKMIELTKIPEPNGETKEIIITFSQIGSVQSKFSCMYFNIIKTFSKELIEYLQEFNLNIYVNTSSQIDFLKVYSKAETKIRFYNQKKSVSISQTNLKQMEEFIMYYRHEKINIPEISYGKEKDRQTIIMIDYLPPFNPTSDFRQCIKNNTSANSSQKDNELELSLESVEFCIVMDISCKNPQRQYDCQQMKFLLDQVLSKIEKTIIQRSQMNESDNQKKFVNYLNFSQLDESGWRQQYFKLKENTKEEHNVIKNQIFSQIEWKNEDSDLISFLDDFTILQNSLNLPKILFLITQGQWMKFDESVEKLKLVKQCIDEKQPLCVINSMNSFQDSIMLNNSNQISNNHSSNILDLFVCYFGEDNYAQEKIISAVTKERFFTKNTIDTPAFPQQDLLYFKQHSEFYLEANRENVEFSTIPLYIKSQNQKSKIQVKYNQIFQQFIFLELGTSLLKGQLRYFNGTSRQQCQVPIEFSKNKKSEKYLQSDDIAMAGLIKLFQSDELIEQIDLMKNMSIQNHIYSPITQEIFSIYDISEGNYSSDASVKEITSFTYTPNKKPSLISSRIPSIVKYEAPKGDLAKPQQAVNASLNLFQSQYKSKDIISELLKKKEERESKINEKKLNFNLSISQTQGQQMKKVKTLVDNQELSGCWQYNESLLSLLQYSKEDFYFLKRRISHRSEPHIDSLIMTSIILIEFKMQFPDYFKYWESCQIKSTNWIDENFPSVIYVKVFRITRELHDSKNQKKKN